MEKVEIFSITVIMQFYSNTLIESVCQVYSSFRTSPISSFMQTDFFLISSGAYASPWFHPSWTIFPQAIQDHFPKLLLISGPATAESSVTVSGSAFTFKFFFGYKSLLLPKKVQKKTIYSLTVNNLFIANI